MMKLFNKIIVFLLSVVALCGLMSFSSSAAVRPKNPVSIKVTSVKEDSVVLSWKKSRVTDFYRVYVKKNDKWKALSDTEKTTYTVKKLNALTTYTFAVRSVNESAGKNYFSENYTTITVKTKALEKNKLSAMASVRHVKLSWTKAPGATGYSIYRKIDGKWKVIKKLSSGKLSFTVKDLKADTAYQFTVRPYTSGDGKKINGPSSNVVKVRTYKPNKVAVRCTAATENSAKLTWIEAPDATGYRVYRYVDGEWKIIKTLNSRDSLSFDVTNLKSDSKYKFRVRPFRKSGKNIILFDISDICTVITDPTKKDLTVKRTENLKKIITGNSFTLSYITENKTYGEMPVTVAKKGEKYYLYSRVNEREYALMNLTSGNFIVLKRQKAYVRVPNALKSTVDVKASLNSLLPSNTGKGKATLEVFDGKKTVCETFEKASGSRTLRYYYRAGELVGIEEYNSKGTLIERATVKSLSTTAGTNMFRVPDGYKRITYSAAKIG